MKDADIQVAINRDGSVWNVHLQDGDVLVLDNVDRAAAENLVDAIRHHCEVAGKQMTVTIVRVGPGQSLGVADPATMAAAGWMRIPEPAEQDGHERLPNEVDGR